MIGSVDLSSFESYRQYVPLAVSALVLCDIVLGSPAANAVLKLGRNDTNAQTADDDATSIAIQKTGRERIDVDSFVATALVQAERVTLLPSYMDEQKTDWDRMDDIKRELDARSSKLQKRNTRDLTE
jgi:hypothetical protein